MNKKNYFKLKNQTKSLKAKNSVAAAQLLIDAALFTVAIFLSLSNSIVIWILGQLLILMCIWRQFSTLHSCAHNTFFKNQKLNLVTGHLCSILSLLPFSDWKKSHIEHHIWAGDRSRDPSLNLPPSEELSATSIKILNICWKLHIPIFSFLVVILKVFNNKKTLTKNSSPVSFSFIFLASSHILLILFLKIIYIKLFLLPFFLYLFTSDFLIISQHNLLGSNDIEKSEFPLPVWDHKRVTKDLVFPNFIAKHVLLNFDQHNLHHILPFVPHYQLNKIDITDYNIGEKEHWLKWLKKVHALPGYKVYIE